MEKQACKVESQACKKWRRARKLQSAARNNFIKNLSPAAANAREDQRCPSSAPLATRTPRGAGVLSGALYHKCVCPREVFGALFPRHRAVWQGKAVLAC